MSAFEEYWSAVRADAHVTAERSLRNKFGRLSNRRILAILRPLADRTEELRDVPDSLLLDHWFTEFARFRMALREAS